MPSRVPTLSEVDASSPERIAIFRQSALGDVVLVGAAVAALRRQRPELVLTWVTSPPMLPLLAWLPGVTPLAVPKVRGPLSWLRAVRQLRAQGPYEVLLAMQASLRAHLLYPALRAKRRIGFPSERGRDGHHHFVNEAIATQNGHLLDEFAAFVSLLGVSITETDLRWLPSPPAEAAAWRQRLTRGDSYVAFHLASSKAERDWPCARYANLIRRMRRAMPRLRAVLTGGSSARERTAAAQISAVVPEVVDLVGQSDLFQLFALCEGAKAVVSPDSAPVHIARAYGVPVVGLYAVARPELSGPFRQLAFTVDAYPEALRQFAGKTSDSAGWHARVHHPSAMKLISVDAVWAKLQAALAMGPDRI